ncbi:MAG: LacI family DNA-binding transcriptional regulator, partial [Clostridia bacterium]|nr:LacI family DNA-binding transcriptional regulator [Clostridia bacterium]
MNIYDISEKAGVSIATVSRVLNDSPHVSQKTREKVLAVINDCDYVPNAFARGLGLNTMKTIGLLCPNAADPYLAEALAHLERAFRQNGYNCLLSCTGRELAS